MPEPSRTRAETFLDMNTALRDARRTSEVWSRIKADAALAIGARETYIVGGDTLGGEDELYLDRLARGARESGSDELSRRLYLELPRDLQDVVRRELLGESRKEENP